MRTVFSLVLLTLTLCSVVVGTASSQPTTIGQFSEFKTAIQHAAPGDTITIQNGTYSNWDQVEITQSGQAGQPITIRAESPGNVVFSGNHHAFIITGDFIVLDGLTFRDRTQRNPNVEAIIWLNGARPFRGYAAFGLSGSWSNSLCCRRVWVQFGAWVVRDIGLTSNKGQCQS